MLTFHLMTAALSPGDAIGNYMLTTARILRGWGVRVFLYADHVAPEYGAIVSHSRYYRARGGDILWYHYSIDADNIAIAQASRDYTILDYHGITPPHLLAGNSHLQTLCQRAINRLPNMVAATDMAIAHSEYTVAELQVAGFDNIHKIPLCIDTTRLQQCDVVLSEELQKLRYLLFIGRIVPQKDILALIRLFAALSHDHPDLALILVGSYHLTPAYKREIDRLIAKLGVDQHILFTGQVNDPQQLAALFAHATFYCALSEWESFCVPVAEALYFGTPAIINNVPPLPEVAGDGGIVVEAGDVTGSAEIITAYLNNPSTYTSLRTRARAYGQRYTDQSLAKNILRTLNTII